jgi:hypothetical protein
MRNHLKGSQFETMEEIQKVMMAVLKNGFWMFFDAWKVV